MIRFPNPKSKLINLRKVFTEAVIPVYLALGKPISHDDIAKEAANKGLVSSSGRIGEEAFKRSYSRDRSRDKIFNQVKMLTEVYRMLGWLLPLPESRHLFIVSPVGFQVGEFRGDGFDEIRVKTGVLKEKDFLGWNLLNICFPHPHVEAKTNQKQRPFAFILKFANALDGYFSRDELILSALQLEDDRNLEKVQSCINLVREWRAGERNIGDFRIKLTRQLKLKYETMCNYTRFLLGAIRDIGWFEVCNFRDLSEDIKAIYERQLGKNARRIKVYCLTKDGKGILSDLSKKIDIRHEDLKEFTEDQLCKFTILIYLIRSQNELSKDDLEKLAPAIEVMQRFDKSFQLHNKTFERLLFEPFQQLSSSVLIRALRSGEEDEI